MNDDRDLGGLPDLAGIDIDRPTPARIYDYWLGGSHNFAADREVAQLALDAMPSVRPTAWANRGFLRRVVKHLVTTHGITQFLDLGSGVPTVGNVHEIAQAANPDCRVVYVDIDPVAVAHSQQLLAGNDRCAIIHADLRDSGTIFDSARLHQILDLSQPVAVLLISVLHFISDEDDPLGIVRAYVDRIPAGSYLSLSHGIRDGANPGGQNSAAGDYQRATRVPVVVRTPEEVAALFGGLEIQPPGLVRVNQWRPDADTAAELIPQLGALAHKPA
jgi:hypothetical protein